MVKAVILAAGYGTRLLPVTRTVPKELLPLVDRPSIDFVLDELERAGIRDVLIITSRRKKALDDWFDHDAELDAVLTGEKRNKAQPRDLNVQFVRQARMGGTGDALMLARDFAGNDPLVVCYPDDLFDPPDVTRRLVEIWERTGACVIAAQDLPGEDVSRYGVLDVDDGLRVRRWVEKPAPGTEPSTLIVLGRYLVTPAFFERLAAHAAAHTEGELYPTGAIDELAAEGQVMAHPIEAERRDTGDAIGYVQAFVDEALSRPEWRDTLTSWLQQRLSRTGSSQ